MVDIIPYKLGTKSADFFGIDAYENLNEAFYYYLSLMLISILVLILLGIGWKRKLGIFILFGIGLFFTGVLIVAYLHPDR